MRILLLPIKDFKDAKQRLSPALPPAERAGLARAMLSDVLTAISAARLPDRIVVFTASEEVAHEARAYKVDVIREDDVRGHSAAVNRMVAELSAAASQILALAGDLPMLEAADVDLMFASAPVGISLVSSRDGTGTNAALFVSPARIEMQYGDGSLRRHLAGAEAAGFAAQVFRVPGIEFDLDTPEDLDLFRQHGRTTSHTWRYLSSIS